MTTERTMSDRVGGFFGDVIADLEDVNAAGNNSDELADAFATRQSAAPVAKATTSAPREATKTARKKSTREHETKPKPEKTAKTTKTAAKRATPTLPAEDAGVPLAVAVSLPPALHLAVTAAWERQRTSVTELIVEALDAHDGEPFSTEDGRAWRREKRASGGGAVPRMVRLRTGTIDRLDRLSAPGRLSRSATVGILLAGHLGVRPGDQPKGTAG